jgi:hypothetical protein
MERIAESVDLSTTVGTDKYFAIADLMIDSDFLMCCLEKQPTPILLLYERRELASSLSDFLSKLVSGKFDFLRAAAEQPTHRLSPR